MIWFQIHFLLTRKNAIFLRLWHSRADATAETQDSVDTIPNAETPGDCSYVLSKCLELFW